MEMALRTSNLLLPEGFVEMDCEEMMYVDGGGISIWAKIGIVAAAVALGAGLAVALAYGQIYLAAKIMGVTFKAFVAKLGAAGVAAVIGEAIGVSATIVIATFNYLGL